MKENTKIENFHIINECFDKHTDRKTPAIREEIREIAGSKDGKKVEISNAKAYRLMIDGREYQEKDFKDLFPNQYTSFNIRKTLTSKMSRGKVELEVVMYFYFPANMLETHSIQLYCRQKMLRVVYQLSK